MGEGEKIKRIIIILGLCLIYDIALIFSFEYLYTDKSKINIYCEVIELKKEYGKKYSYVVKDIKKGAKLIVYTKDILVPGDILKLTGEFSFPSTARNYKGFNYRNYLKQRKIYGIIKVESIFKLHTKKDIYYLKGKIQDYLVRQIENIYNKEVQGFLESILLGYTNNLPNSLRETLELANISHIIAISGMHMFYVEYISKKFLKILKNKKLENLILIFILISFCVFTGMSVSSVRACIMNIIFISSFFWCRKYNVFRSLIFSFLIILISNPFNIFNVGMWLSFFGILGINLFFKFIKLVFNHYKIKHRIIDSLIISISVQIVIFPILIYSFNLFPITFLISSIIVFLFIDKVIILGYVSLILFPNGFGTIFAKANEFIIKIFFSLIKYISQIKLYVKTPSFIFLIFYYLFLTIICIFYKRNKHYVLRLLCSRKALIIFIKRTYSKTRKYILIFALILFLCTRININHNLNIYFVDVGQGDCCLIKTPNRKNILIDGGEGNNDKYDYGKNVVLPYLLDRKVIKLDYVIISHFDSDHCGGLFYVMENIKVEKVIIGKQFELCENYEKFIKLVKDKNIKVYIVEKGQRINIEKDLYIDVLWPCMENVITENSINNNSLVGKLVYKDFSILFTGDIEKRAEEKIFVIYKDNLNMLNSTVLKVAHHGSKTSCNLQFLKAVSPKLALIGVGENNTFGHPSSITLENLESIGCRTYRTDKNGEISIQVNKKGKIWIDKKLN